MAEFLEQFESCIRGKEHLPAYLLDDQQISLGEVNSFANRFAHWLSNTRRGDVPVVGICTEASLVTGPLVLGILKAGKAFLGLDPAYPPERLRYMVDHSGCDLILTDGTVPSGQFGNTTVLTVREIISLIWNLSDSNRPKQVSEDLPAYLTFTSGSTGRPKPVLAPVRQVDNRFSWMWDAYPFDDDEVCCSRMPLSFIDSVWEILGPICKATPVALIPAKRFRAGAVLVKKLESYRVSRIWMLPAAINELTELFPDLGRRLPKLRFWVCTGDTLSPGLVAKLYRAVPRGRLFNLYGTSEIWDATWYEVPARGTNGLFVPIGKPIKNVGICVVDKHGPSVPNGAVGEIAVSGRGLALGYGDPSPPGCQPFVDHVAGRDEWFYKTGDYGRFLKNGDLLFLGRRESTIDRRGEPVRLIEVEAALTLHPHVMEGAAWSRIVDSGEVLITGYYHVKGGHALREQDLMSFLRDHLASTALPDQLVQLNEFPKTPSGKIDRRLLPSWQHCPASAENGSGFQSL